jgi:DNA-binding MarR family transcriptional regulator
MILAMTETDADATTAAITSVEAEFGEMFNRARTSMRDRATRVHPSLQPGSYMILSTLARVGPMHASALADMLATDKSIVSRQAKQLEGAGLLIRRSDPEDKRATFFDVTPDARRRLDEVRTSERATLYAQLGTWTVADLNRLAELLARVNETL